LKVLVTGISGFIGHHVAEALHAHGHELRGLIRRTSDRSGITHLPVEIAEGDILDRAALAQAMIGVDAVVHLAGVSTKAVSPEDFQRLNVRGTRNVIEAAVAEGAKGKKPRLIYISSQSAGGPAPAGTASDGADPEAPLSRYGESKLAAEGLVRAAAGQLDAVIIRPPIVYGPRDRDILAAFKLAKLARGLFFHPGFQEKRYSVVYGPDLGEGIAQALEGGLPVSDGRSDRGRGVYYLDDGHAYSWSELGRLLVASLGLRPIILKVPELVPTAIAFAQEIQAVLTKKPPLLGFDKVRDMRATNFVCSSERARRDFAYAPKHDLATGFVKTAKWYTENGWL
jgi:dihydroflavonol-4-reductase